VGLGIGLPPPPGPACAALPADAGASPPALSGFVGHDSSEGVNNLIYCHLGGLANSLEAGAQCFKLRWYVDGIRKIRHLLLSQN
jgi:hypothetical protein